MSSICQKFMGTVEIMLARRRNNTAKFVSRLPVGNRACQDMEHMYLPKRTLQLKQHLKKLVFGSVRKSLSEKWHPGPRCSLGNRDQQQPISGSGLNDVQARGATVSS